MQVGKKFIKSGMIGIAVAALLFIIFGSVAAVIPNPFFIRMTPVTWIEYTTLIATSLLLGVYIGLSYYSKLVASKACNVAATSGGIFGFLTFGCVLCNKLLILLLGVVGVLTYFEPIRPFFGLGSVGLLGVAIVYKGKQLIKSYNGG